MPASWSSTTCSSWPGPCCVTPSHGPAVRATLHERYDRLLLDEFQDTDPIQIELAVRIAAADPREPVGGQRTVGAGWTSPPGTSSSWATPSSRSTASAGPTSPRSCGPAERFGSEGGGVVELTANFRTVEPIIDWVNHTFAALMSEPDRRRHAGSTRSPRTWPSRRPGRRHRPGPRWRSSGATNTRRAPRPTSCARPRRARWPPTVTRIMDEGWDVSDEQDGAWRPARLGDITVLVPARTSLPFLEDAFDQAGIAFRAETSSLVYASRAVRDLLMVLRAVDDPTNYLHIVSALRTPLLACGDDDLFRFKWERKGRWSYLADQPDTVPHRRPGSGRPELPARRCTTSAPGWPPPSCSDRIVRDRRAMELGLRRGPAPRRVAAAALRDRPGSGLERGHRRQPAPVPALGDRADSRGRSGDRVDPARERRRRGAHPDHPRRQGPGVPDHDRVGDVDGAIGTTRAGRGGLSRRRAASATGSATRSARTSTWTGRRSTNRWASTSGSACCTWRAPGPVTTWSCRCTARPEPSRRPARRRAPMPSCCSPAWAMWSTTSRTAAATLDVLRPAVVTSPSPPPPFAQWAAERTAALRAGRPSRPRWPPPR